MQNKARVTPRNIQFKEDVQIREIPSRNEDIPELIREDSWNPNLAEETFRQKPTKQRNVVIAIAVCGAVVIAAIIGTVLGIALSQKTTTIADQSLTYNDVCTTNSNQCKSSQGLSCPHGFCACSSPYSWNQNTRTCTLLTYNQACSSSNQCNSSLGLNCTNQFCLCDAYHSWNGTNNTCVMILNNTLNYGDTCAIGSYQCNSTRELICTGNCSCPNGKIWNASACMCPAGTFVNSSNLCETAYKFNISCVIGSNQCDSTRNLSCNTNTSLCQCDPTNYWNRNFEICLFRMNYTQFCSADSDCLPTLTCPPIPGVCSCPLYLPDYVCNCATTMYFNYSISQCVNRSTFNGPCITSTNYTCLSNLYCNTGTCLCPLGTNWIVANSTCA